MTILYPLTNQIDNTELLYSLRSVEKYLSKPYEVVIIGSELPEWITNITWINLPDIRGRKQLSIRRKILIGLEYAKEFLFMNDDVYFVKNTNEFPYYWHGTLKKYVESGARPLEKKLLELNKPLKLFDGHYPLMYDQRFKEASKYFHPDCIIKSMYCNYFGIEGVFASDCKVLKQLKLNELEEFIKDKVCFSTGTASLNSALPFLQQLFPDKSQFEL